VRIAVISDIHANLKAIERTLEDLKSKNIDEIYCTGDLVGYAPFPNEVIEIIKSRNIITVQGNHDEKVGCSINESLSEAKVIELSDGGKAMHWTKNHVTESNKSWLRSLPKSIEIEKAGKKIMLVHGSPRKNSEYIYEDGENHLEIMENFHCDILVCGHTHMPFKKEVEGKLLINAGSVGKPKHGNCNATYVILELSEKAVEVSIEYVPYEALDMVEEIVKSEIPDSLGEKLILGIG